jgi:hypothetical protein
MAEYVIFAGMIAIWLFVSYELNHLLKYFVVTRIIMPAPHEYHEAMEIPFPIWVWMIIAPLSTLTTITIVWILDILIRGF